ncbi:apolipoprotein N-acyltransferase [Nostoc sp. CENA67]|uniref:Apolipoprotein N-acyltransferase n=1 Tax=Amazonocrinis nigriterrae CENA67 TaxID=2794033 RepID=A0A8J7LBQ4_9NOST|nr:apolipoprotein N-acyltransferase [Amazonocrinis nigriterrae]MBH8565990.1 apolipoprotein N-acyltransferase [Amazonocrinis nigriterrae CENA67]
MQKKLSKKQGEGLSLLPYLIALSSGVLMGLTVAPVDAWFLAWIALAPLWVLVITSAKHKNQSPPASPALFWGIGYHGVALFWITGIHPMDWLGVPWWPSLAITLFCWSFISLYGGVFVAIWAAVMARAAKQKPWLRILIGTSIWCGLEALWSAGPLWWSSLAYTQSPHNLIILHLGQLSGTTTITATIVAINGLIAEAWINRQGAKNLSASSAPWRFVNPYLAIATTLLITLHLIGLALYSQPIAQPPAAALKIGVIQGNIPNKIKLTPEGLRRAITGYTNGYLTLVNQGVNAVLTPEGAMPFFQRDLAATPLISAVKEKGVVAWVGAFGERGRSYTNSLFTVIGSGEITSRYDKSKLVPLGEYIPFESILGGIISRLSPLDEHQVPGAANQIFDTPFGRAIVGICYESAFPEQFRRQAGAGGQFILSSSNDAHYSASMPFQHHAQDIMRAIETDRWTARATNTGYSAFVDPHGRTLWISRYNTYETHAETIYRRQTQTFYVRWGDWLTPLLLGLGALAWGCNIFWQNDGNTKLR